MTMKHLLKAINDLHMAHQQQESGRRTSNSIKKVPKKITHEKKDRNILEEKREKVRAQRNQEKLAKV